MTALSQHGDALPHRASTLTFAAGALFAVVPLLVELVAGELFALMGLALILLVASLPALHRLQQGRDGPLGSWGTRLAVGGFGALVVLALVATVVGPRLSPAVQAVAEAVYRALALVAALAALGGVVAFSAGLGRAGVLWAPGIRIFLAGMVLGLTSESFEQSLRGPVPWLADVLPVLGFVLAGAGLVALGVSARAVEGNGTGLRARRRPPAPAPGAASPAAAPRPPARRGPAPWTARSRRRR